MYNLPTIYEELNNKIKSIEEVVIGINSKVLSTQEVVNFLSKKDVVVT